MSATEEKLRIANRRLQDAADARIAALEAERDLALAVIEQVATLASEWTLLQAIFGRPVEDAPYPSTPAERLTAVLAGRPKS